MPSKSQKQQKAMGIAYAAKKGKIPPSTLYGAAKHLYDNMSLTDLKEFASTKRAGLPKRACPVILKTARFDGVKRFVHGAGDMINVARGKKPIKLKVELSPEVKKYIEQQMKAFKVRVEIPLKTEKIIEKQISSIKSKITPWHILGGATIFGAGSALGKILVRNSTKEKDGKNEK